ncbi:MAG: neutral/alkaline non-lysosomal ceramidase N-terminal domain-containing protein [Deltaproteobacteria bacterium]|nr:neutral/alkaline non-lysosomal ceramidase N-terminal domain-containing protein [Deltaproteobacteria bacterium]
MGKVQLIVLLGALLLVGGCGPKRIPVALSIPPSGSGTHTLAGAAKIDITPPLGGSLFGHGPNSPRARGHRGRLHCRAVYLEDLRGEALALVVCDLQSISLLLHHEVAAELQRRIGLGMDRILLSATHTHAGPAHYFGSESYSGPLSSARPGRDPRMVRLLTDRIADVVVLARDRARTGGEARLSWVDAELPPGTVRNSSLEPHCDNGDPMAGGATTCGKPQVRPDPEAEVDRSMTVLKVERKEGAAWKLIALHATIAMHPTVVENLNTLFHADAYGVATEHAEGVLNQSKKVYPDPTVVVALANGAGADVIGNYHRQTWDEARRIGGLIGQTLVQAATREVTPQEGFELARAFGIYRLSRAPVLDPETPGAVPPRIAQQGARPGAALCKDAELGNATAGGAEDGRTAFYYASPLFRDGVRKPKRRDRCHRPRLSFQTTFQKVTFAHHGFPESAPLQVVRIGDRALVAVPAELSTTAGLTLQAELEAQLEKRVRVVGYANGYMQYITTWREYRWQYYQGASNLWGPETLAFLWARLSKLAARAPWSDDRAVDLAEPETAFRLPGERRRLPDPLDLPARDAKVLWSRPLPGGGGFELVWRGRSPSTLHPDADGDGVADPLPVLLRVDQCDDAGNCQPLTDALGRPVDDRSSRLELTYLGRRSPEQTLPGARELKGHELHDPKRKRKKDFHHWQARWFAEGTAPGTYRMTVVDREGGVLLGQEVVVPE